MSSQKKLAELETHPSLAEVLRTQNIEGTVELLVLMTVDLQYRYVFVCVFLHIFGISPHCPTETVSSIFAVEH